MCNSLTTISQVNSGILTFCKTCNIYHLEFSNIYLEFSEAQFEEFSAYLFTIEIGYWEHKYANVNIKRKIPIPTTQDNLMLLFNRHEIEELKVLFCSKSTSEKPLLDVSQIDYTLVIN
ncbi:DUF6686 family protein [uncultured Kordia sp.]|uniref:DUF6686 family protein n=1 Tax=uncultured Kordia sp. TaxID=507699 RepID=UPI002603873B|nr:DUF6686 family protein [uncultured Kordia sp.]